MTRINYLPLKGGDVNQPAGALHKPLVKTYQRIAVITFVQALSLHLERLLLQPYQAILRMVIGSIPMKTAM